MSSSAHHHVYLVGSDTVGYTYTQRLLHAIHYTKNITLWIYDPEPLRLQIHSHRLPYASLYAKNKYTLGEALYRYVDEQQKQNGTTMTVRLVKSQHPMEYLRDHGDSHTGTYEVIITKRSLLSWNAIQEWMATPPVSPPFLRIRIAINEYYFGVYVTLRDHAELQAFGHDAYTQTICVYPRSENRNTKELGRHYKNFLLSSRYVSASASASGLDYENIPDCLLTFPLDSQYDPQARYLGNLLWITQDSYGMSSPPLQQMVLFHDRVKHHEPIKVSKHLHDYRLLLPQSIYMTMTKLKILCVVPIKNPQILRELIRQIHHLRIAITSPHAKDRTSNIYLYTGDYYDSAFDLEMGWKQEATNKQEDHGERHEEDRPIEWINRIGYEAYDSSLSFWKGLDMILILNIPSGDEDQNKDIVPCTLGVGAWTTLPTRIYQFERPVVYAGFMVDASQHTYLVSSGAIPRETGTLEEQWVLGIPAYRDYRIAQQQWYVFCQHTMRTQEYHERVRELISMYSQDAIYSNVYIQSLARYIRQSLVDLRGVTVPVTEDVPVALIHALYDVLSSQVVCLPPFETLRDALLSELTSTLCISYRLENEITESYTETSVPIPYDMNDNEQQRCVTALYQWLYGQSEPSTTVGSRWYDPDMAIDFLLMNTMMYIQTRRIHQWVIRMDSESDYRDHTEDRVSFRDLVYDPEIYSGKEIRHEIPFRELTVCPDSFSVWKQIHVYGSDMDSDSLEDLVAYLEDLVECPEGIQRIWYDTTCVYDRNSKTSSSTIVELADPMGTRDFLDLRVEGSNPSVVFPHITYIHATTRMNH